MGDTVEAGSWTFYHRGRRHAVRHRSAPVVARAAERLTISSEDQARAYLQRAALEAGVAARLRAIAFEALPLGARRVASSDDWLPAMCRAVARGELTLFLLPEAAIPGGGGVAAPPLVTSKETTWVEFVVVWAHDGSPVAGLSLDVQLPGRAEAPKTTDADGRIRFDGIKSGVCRVSSSYVDRRASDCVNFAGRGELESSAGARDERKGTPRPKAVALLQAHRVRRTDTLESLATSVGLTWQALARFNWGTDSPDGVNDHLRDDVGCWAKTEDGKNYVFSDFDDPGIVVLPRAWSVGGLPTADSHTLRVERLPPPLRFMTWSV